MAAKPPTPEIQALIQRAGIARSNLANSADSLRAKLDAKTLLKKSVRSHPTRWLVGASATGLLASRLLFRRKPAPKKARVARRKKSHPVLFFVLRTVSNAIMPAVKIWLLTQIRSYLMSRVSGKQKPFPH